MRGLMTGLLALCVLFSGSSSASALQSTGSPTISPSVGQGLLDVLALEAEQDWAAAEAGYTLILARARLSDFERATLYQLRGRSRYEIDQITAALTDWESALALQALPPEAATQLQLNIGQLYMSQGRYAAAIEMIERALMDGAELSSDLAMRLAQSHALIDRHAAGLRYARAALELAEQAGRREHAMLLHYYQVLERDDDQLGLIEIMVSYWPEEKSYWSNYAALLSQGGDETAAFDVHVVMYLSGHLSEERELLRLAQYYSYYDYPYRGAEILERELNSGRVAASPANLRLLANMWRQAREWDRATPVLHRVATTTGAGPDFETLGEALFQSGQFGEAEAMFEQALRQGGLNRPGDTWTLLGNARVEQDDLPNAMRAFRRAMGFDYSRATAQGWLDYIARVEEIRAGPVDIVVIEECELWIERERRTIPLPGEINAEGRRVFALPETCNAYFDAFGDRLPQWRRA